ncbi:neuronal acetylcholine receptor subunit eat-2-like, partial [Convolutriloba macropyga]|uniref:neuronal acetylcholine receptor subunit eat-2-like n=1 Tax=Convolutriloba macropyga TaxID=536237 RepID=UPI003F526C0B
DSTNDVINDTLSNGVDYENKVVNRLKKVLPKYVPPFDMEDRLVKVYLDLLQILKMDEKMGVWEVKLSIYLRYNSPSATWNNSQWGTQGLLDALTFPHSTFWSPDIVALDVSEAVYESFEKQVIYSNGNVFAWSALMTVKLSCAFDVTYFPYDEQSCSLKLTPFLATDSFYRMDWDIEYLETLTPSGAATVGPDLFNKHVTKSASSQDYLEGNVNKSNDERVALISLQYFIPNDQWELVGKPQLTRQTRFWFRNQFDELRMHVKVKRRPEFYEVALLFPFSALYVLSSLVFLIPVECGERVSFAVTVLLSQLVLFASLLDVIPSSSLNMPRALLGMRLVFCHLGFNCLATIIVITVYYGNGPTTTKCFNYLLREKVLTRKWL